MCASPNNKRMFTKLFLSLILKVNYVYLMCARVSVVTTIIYKISIFPWRPGHFGMASLDWVMYYLHCPESSVQVKCSETSDCRNCVYDVGTYVIRTFSAETFALAKLARKYLRAKFVHLITLFPMRGRGGQNAPTPTPAT